MNNAVVLFSGGQDSTTCLAYALAKYEKVFTLGFAYGQRHEVELSCRQKILELLPKLNPSYAEKLGQDLVIHLDDFSKLTNNALTSKQKEFKQAPGELPTSFVPARNLIFLTLAAAWAYELKANTLVCGVSQTDYSGYPDCRADTMGSMAQTLTLGLDCKFSIDTPLMYLSKAETWKLAENLGGQSLVELILEQSATCYQGERKLRHAWGYGCGTCPSCVLRKKGFEEYLNLKSCSSNLS